MPKTQRVAKASVGLRRVASRCAGSSTPETKASEIVRDLNRLFSKNSDPSNALPMKKYMRGKFEFYGLKSPQRRLLVKEVLSSKGQPDLMTLREVLKLAFLEDKRELQMFGVDYAIRHVKILAGDDDKNVCLESLECVRQLITTKSWWDTVDMLACSVIGPLVKRHHLVTVMDSWITSPDMWVRRTAILHQLSYNQDTDKDLLFRYCLTCCHEQEFFIQKAIGWALRNYFRYNPKDVKAFVNKNRDKLAKLSVREALKHA